MSVFGYVFVRVHVNFKMCACACMCYQYDIYYVAMEFDKCFVLPENLTYPLCLCDSVFPGMILSALVYIMC